MEKQLICVELNHEQAPLFVRERISLNDTEVCGLLREFKASIKEVLVLSTCNRFAVYAYADTATPILDYFKQFGDLMNYLEVSLSTEETVQRLFETAGGMRSQVIGEHQIIGQIKNAYELAKTTGTLGPVMDEFIRQAINVGKRIRTETNIGRCANSLAGVSLEMARRAFPDIKNKSVLIIGTGKMAGLSAYAFYKAGISEVYVASHDDNRATAFCEEFGGVQVGIGSIISIMHTIDIVIGGTHGEVSLFDEPGDSQCKREQLGFLMDGRQRLFIDLGVPRNFNPLLKEVPNMNLFDLDDLKVEVKRNGAYREDELPKAKAIVDEEIKKYAAVLTLRLMSPEMGAYWNKLNGIKEDRLNWLMPKLDLLDEAQEKLIRKFAHHIIRDVSRNVFKQVRREAEQGKLPMEIISSVQQSRVSNNETN